MSITNLFYVPVRFSSFCCFLLFRFSICISLSELFYQQNALKFHQCCLKWQHFIMCVCELLYRCMFCLVAKLSLTVWDSMGSSVHGNSQARMQEWVAISFSRDSSRPRDKTWVSCIGRQILYNLSH